MDEELHTTHRYRLSGEGMPWSSVSNVISAIQAATKLSLRCAIVGSEATQKECRGFAETQAWLFAGTFEQALALLK